MEAKYSFRDISLNQTYSLIQSVSPYDLAAFMGRATCIDISKVVFNSVLDTNILKQLTSNIRLEDYSIVLFYTGHFDRFYNTSLWSLPKTFITPSAMSYLDSLGVKNIGIDSPFFIKKPFHIHSLILTYNLSNIGHLCGKDFFYVGLPILNPDNINSSPIRASILEPSL